MNTYCFTVLKPHNQGHHHVVTLYNYSSQRRWGDVCACLLACVRACVRACVCARACVYVFVCVTVCFEGGMEDGRQSSTQRGWGWMALKLFLQIRL